MISMNKAQQQRGITRKEMSVKIHMYSFQSEEVDIRLEILSNWGHASRVGLTEIQLLQSSGALLPVPSTGVTARSAQAQSGPPSVLFNGKAKVRGRYKPWSVKKKKKLGMGGHWRVEMAC